MAFSKDLQETLIDRCFNSLEVHIEAEVGINNKEEINAKYAKFYNHYLEECGNDNPDAYIYDLSDKKDFCYVWDCCGFDEAVKLKKKRFVWVQKGSMSYLCDEAQPKEVVFGRWDDIFNRILRFPSCYSGPDNYHIASEVFISISQEAGLLDYSEETEIG